MGCPPCLSTIPITYYEASDSISKGWERYGRCKTWDEQRVSFS